MLDSEYVNQKQILHFICKKHEEKGVQTIKYANFKYKNNGCHFCAKENFQNNRRTPIDEAKRITEIKGLEFVDIVYSSENHKTQATIQYICPKHKYLGIQEAPLSQIKNGKYGCNYCNFVLDTFTFKEKLKDRGINYFDVIGEYKDQDTLIGLKCKIHNINYYARPRKIFEGINSCPECIHYNLKTQSLLSKEEAQEKLNQTHPTLHIIGSYENTFTPVEIFCDKHNCKFMCAINNYLYKGKYECCPQCNISSGEDAVLKFLIDNKYNFVQQKTFSECKVKQVLPFDFYLNDLNICIEYQGEQHYYPIDYFGGKNRYDKQIIYDDIKRKFCIENNIKLIEIPYWEKENITNFLWYQLDESQVINNLIK